MDKIHLLPQNERFPYFEVAASQMKLAVSMIEKDYWVVWALERLFNLHQVKDYLTFKGGTSLSKVYGLIKRFSEDIDLSIEKSFFGFSDKKSPDQAPTKKQRNKMLEQLSTECSNYVQGPFLQMLREDFAHHLQRSEGWNLLLDESDLTKQTLLFEYPSSSPSKTNYIRSSVKIEIGARSEHWPVSHHKIQSYVQECLKEKVNAPQVSIKVLNVERTFWEKATILHQYAHIPSDKALPLRLSRHYYDFYCLLNAPVKIEALAQEDLLEKVAHHKALYFPSAWANYSSAKKGGLKLVPPLHLLNDLEKDYRLMRDMFFETPPSLSFVSFLK